MLSGPSLFFLWKPWNWSGPNSMFDSGVNVKVTAWGETAADWGSLLLQVTTDTKASVSLSSGMSCENIKTLNWICACTVKTLHVNVSAEISPFRTAQQNIKTSSSVRSHNTFHSINSLKVFFFLNAARLKAVAVDTVLKTLPTSFWIQGERGCCVKIHDKAWSFIALTAYIHIPESKNLQCTFRIITHWTLCFGGGQRNSESHCWPSVCRVWAQ